MSICLVIDFRNYRTDLSVHYRGEIITGQLTYATVGDLFRLRNMILLNDRCTVHFVSECHTSTKDYTRDDLDFIDAILAEHGLKPFV